MRIVFIRGGSFALIFFFAALIMERGHLLKVLLLTGAATAAYLLVMGAMQGMGKHPDSRQ